jgi:hypothetical protein
VRKKKQEILERKSSIITEPIHKARTPIENMLLQKHAKSQAKINNLRNKQQIKETEDLKPVPKINKISKQIVEMREKGHSDSVSLYTAKLLSGSRSSSSIRIVPKQGFLSLIDLKVPEAPRKGFETVTNRKQDKTFEQDDEKIIAHDFAMLKEPRGSEKGKVLQDLRESVFSKYNVAEPAKPMANILQMSVLDRNDLWLKSKNDKLTSQKEAQTKQETTNCTFSPRLKPRVSSTHDPRPATALINSYSQQSLTKPSQQKPQSTPQNSIEKPDPTKIMLYKSLSPHQRTFSQGQGMSLLYKSRPLVSHKF